MIIKPLILLDSKFEVEKSVDKRCRDSCNQYAKLHDVVYVARNGIPLSPYSLLNLFCVPIPKMNCNVCFCLLG